MRSLTPGVFVLVVFGSSECASKAWLWVVRVVGYVGKRAAPAIDSRGDGGQQYRYPQQLTEYWRMHTPEALRSGYPTATSTSPASPPLRTVQPVFPTAG